MVKDFLMKKYGQFFDSENYKCCNANMQSIIYSLLEEFIQKGFDIYPIWREKHKTQKNKVFIFKTNNSDARNGESNVVTVYQKATNLKIEVYYNEDRKINHYYGLDGDNQALIQEAQSYYENFIGKTLRIPDYSSVLIKESALQKDMNEKIKTNEVRDCPFEIDCIVTNKGRGNAKAKIISKDTKYFEVLWEQSGKTSKYANTDALTWFYIEQL